MKREDQKRNRELGKKLDILMKECPKKYKAQKLKKKDYMLWTTRGNMIYEIMPFARIRESDIKPIMSFMVGYKPLWIDDLLWDILKMESNKQEPDSLRVVGAFTVSPAKLPNDIIELECEDEDYLRSVLYEKIDTILDYFQELDEEKFIEYQYADKFADEYNKVLIAIHQNDKDTIKELLSVITSSGRFGNEGKMFRELLLEYLDREHIK